MDIDGGGTSTANKTTDIQEPLPACTKTASDSALQTRMFFHFKKKQSIGIRNNIFRIIKTIQNFYIYLVVETIRKVVHCAKVLVLPT